MVNLDNIMVKFEYQGHNVKNKVMYWKMLIWLTGYYFNVVYISGVKVIMNMVKVKINPRSNC